MLNVKAIEEMAYVIVDEIRKQYNDELNRDECLTFAHNIIRTNMNTLMRLSKEVDVGERDRKVRNIVKNWMKLNSFKE